MGTAVGKSVRIPHHDPSIYSGLLHIAQDIRLAQLRLAGYRGTQESKSIRLAVIPRMEGDAYQKKRLVCLPRTLTSCRSVLHSRLPSSLHRRICRYTKERVAHLYRERHHLQRILDTALDCPHRSRGMGLEADASCIRRGLNGRAVTVYRNRAHTRAGE